MGFKMKWKSGRSGIGHEKKQMTPRGAVVFGCIFCGIALLFSGVGLYQVVRQQLVMSRVVEVPGTVMNKSIKTIRSSNGKGGTSTSYRPVIEHTFAYKGTTYAGHQYNFMDESGGHDWAKNAIGKYQIGATYPVFVDPNDPKMSFLSRGISVGPYLFIVFPMIHFCVGAGIALRNGLKWPKRRIWGFLAASWGIVGGTAFSHYFASASGPYGWLPIICAAIYLLATTILLIGWQRSAQVNDGKEEAWPKPMHGETVR